MSVTLADIALARYRLAPHLPPTPLEEAPAVGAGVWLKLENANRTHSFKVRGALNAVLALDEVARGRGLVAASTGNHAQGVAYAARLVGARARIVMPVHTPKKKLAGVERYGAQPVLYGAGYDDAERLARGMERDEGLTFVSAYNDPQVVAGAGTIGMEILETLPGVTRVVVPVSGGGLISGVALAVKSLRPSVEVVGVCAQSGPAMYNVFYATQHPEQPDTLAEALLGDIEAGSITLDLARRCVDRIVLVSEKAIAQAVRLLLGTQGWLVEGGGAVGVAALLSGVLPAEGTTAVVVSGGNIDLDRLRRVLDERG